MLIDLAKEELELLREILERADADLRDEVHKTEAADWKKALKARERLVAALLAKFGRA